MSAIAQPLLWCCLQVTVLALAALVFNGLFARRRPAAGAVVAARALFAVVGFDGDGAQPLAQLALELGARLSSKSRRGGR